MKHRIKEPRAFRAARPGGYGSVYSISASDSLAA